MIIFGIETSCDETAAAVVESGTREICSVVASSKEFHEKTGGIVPEVAARKQVEFITPVISECFEKYRKEKKFDTLEDCYRGIDAVAVTVGPGLIGSLVVGVEAAKALSLFLNKPLIPVNHLVGHIYGNFVNNTQELLLPAIVLLVSGGHTDLVLMKDHGNFEYLGGTLDDAVGEAYDKVARLLGLSKYLGGAILSKKALECDENTIKGRLPRPMVDQDNFDFSFSGLKTASKRIIELNQYPQEVIAREFEEAVVEVLVKKTIRAARKFNVKTIMLGGGVSANIHLREEVKKEADKLGISTQVPPIRLCTDNAVYIASAAYFNNKSVGYENVEVNPSLGIMDKL
ncbi:tRNA (adenosine(37)-N6)-threonylcarbamoyltransferase complex transferase subunit TsaD [candidate division WWE3 bacterium]|uniref:tRNA N6-adenosine threonylcarbamoyltransferase n=1 Tax=candidate division WWE3 bacterium TaxID=2053526 RepID=A0A7X9HSJ7_UNCKA|nr:tRNA (adenosine(37)-N6)-threonylcarbamoyltransferase complex transferase subunit TsaD [candidate division WWE3 bacterium]